MRVDAVIGTGRATLIAITGHAVAVVIAPAITTKGLQAQMRQMRAELRAGMLGLTHQQFEDRWSAVFDQIEGWGKRGPHTSSSRAEAFQQFDAEVAAGRDPEHKKFAGVLGRHLMEDPGQIRRWRKEWKKERGYN
jgi:hypothetical protein